MRADVSIKIRQNERFRVKAAAVAAVNYETVSGKHCILQTKTSMYHHHVLLAVIYIFTDSSLTQALINNVLHNKCDISNLLSSTKVIYFQILF